MRSVVPNPFPSFQDVSSCLVCTLRLAQILPELLALLQTYQVVRKQRHLTAWVVRKTVLIASVWYEHKVLDSSVYVHENRGLQISVSHVTCSGQVVKFLT